MAVFWVVAPCSLVELYQRFRGPCCLHHQGDESSLHGATTQKTIIFILTAVKTSNPTYVTQSHTHLPTLIHGNVKIWLSFCVLLNSCRFIHALILFYFIFSIPTSFLILVNIRHILKGRCHVESRQAYRDIAVCITYI
jgi:hypothetical protein